MSTQNLAAGTPMQDSVPKNCQREPWNWILVMSFVIFLSLDPLIFYTSISDAKERRVIITPNFFVSKLLISIEVGLCFVCYFAYLCLSFSPENWANHVTASASASWMDVILCVCNIVLRWFVITWPEAMTDANSWLRLVNLFIFTYFFVVIRVSVLFTKVTEGSGIFSQAKWTKVMFNLLLYVHAAHVLGALWYSLAISRRNWCLMAYLSQNGCSPHSKSCEPSLEDCKFLKDRIVRLCEFGLFREALQSGILEERELFVTFIYCLRWGLQTISCFGQNLQPSTYWEENVFVNSICIYGVVLFAFLVGNIQTYLKSKTGSRRSEKTRIGGREEEVVGLLGPEPEQWVSFKKLSEKFQNEVRKYQPYKCQKTASVDMENWFKNLPTDINKKIKLELCLELLRKVEEFEKLGELSLRDLCNLLKPVTLMERTCFIRKGDLIYEMLFVVQGKLRIYTSAGTTRSSRGNNLRNRKSNYLKDGDIWGKELVTWVQADTGSVNLPISNRSIQVVSNVEAFALMADDMQNMFAKHKAIVLIQSFWRSRSNVQASTHR